MTRVQPRLALLGCKDLAPRCLLGRQPLGEKLIFFLLSIQLYYLLYKIKKKFLDFF